MNPFRMFPIGCRPFDFRQCAILRQAQDAAHVSEAGEAGNEPDESVSTVLIERKYFGFCQGIASPRDGAIEPEREDVFNIKLKLIDFQAGEGVGERKERFKARNASAADIEIKSPVRKCGTILDGARGNVHAELTHELAQGLYSVEQSGGAVSGDMNRIGGHADGIGLGGTCIGRFENNATVFRGSLHGNRRTDWVIAPQVRDKCFCSKDVLRTGIGEENGDRLTRGKESMAGFKIQRLRQNMEGHCITHLKNAFIS